MFNPVTWFLNIVKKARQQNICASIYNFPCCLEANIFQVKLFCEDSVLYCVCHKTKIRANEHTESYKHTDEAIQHFVQCSSPPTQVIRLSGCTLSVWAHFVIQQCTELLTSMLNEINFENFFFFMDCIKYSAFRVEMGLEVSVTKA